MFFGSFAETIKLHASLDLRTGPREKQSLAENSNENLIHGNDKRAIGETLEGMAFAFADFGAELERELSLASQNQAWTFTRLDERLFLLQGWPHPGGSATPLVWAQFVALNGQRRAITSIGDAVRVLREPRLPRGSHSIAHHRRCELIRAQAKDAPLRRVDFLEFPAENPWLFWTLLSPQELWLSSQCSPAVVMGLREFNEDKSSSPSRAYLKLWEIFTYAIHPPESGQRVLDLGAAPGGWTWVLAQLGCDVTAFDKGKLTLPAHPSIRFFAKDVYALKPSEWNADWLCCDMITEPARLLPLLQQWLAAKPQLRCVCTIKFKGPTDFAVVTQFLQTFPGSRCLHLYHNKHELTWVHNVDMRPQGLLDKLPAQI